MAHGTGFGERLDYLRDGRALLADRAVDADQVVLGAVDDGVDDDRGLARLPVADDEFALAAADGNHRIDGLDACGHGFPYRLAIDDAGSEPLHGEGGRGGDRTLVVDGCAERVDDAANHRFPDGHVQDPAGALDLVALGELGVVAHDHGAHLILFKAHRQAGNAVGKGEEFARHDLVQAMDAGDAVAERNDGSNLIDPDFRVVIRDLLAENLRNLVCFDLSHACSSCSFGRSNLENLEAVRFVRSFCKTRPGRTNFPALPSIALPGPGRSRHRWWNQSGPPRRQGWKRPI